MKGHCKYCGALVDETEQMNGICLECANDRLKYPVLFSELDIKSKDGLMTDICERVLLLEKSGKGTKEYLLMRDSYIQASNLLEEIHFKVEKLTAELNTMQTMLNDMKSLFQKGWGVPK